MSNYHSIEITIDPVQYDEISAWLSQLAFESFYEADHALIGYYQPAELSKEQIEEVLESLKLIYTFTYEFKALEDKNWNEEWEKNFKPVTIGEEINIRADFHPKVEGIEHDIIINPKMAFGTAHHETTYMMMDRMLELDWSSKKVLDYGCGTSILAILADMLGAKEITAIDYDIHSVTNSEENCQLNKTTDIKILHGEIDAIKDEGYDIVLANINRNVLLNTATDVRKLMHDDGILIMSGILETDLSLITDVYTQDHFTLENKNQKGEWLCLEFTAR